MFLSVELVTAIRCRTYSSLLGRLHLVFNEIWFGFKGASGIKKRNLRNIS